MNPLHSREKTLDQMLTELKHRLGFVSQGSGSKLNDPILKSFLQEGQEYVFHQLDAPLARKRTEIVLAPGSKLYDFHNDSEDEDIDPYLIDAVDLYETDTNLVSLRQGITEKMRSTTVERSVPERWDVLNGQLELFPIPDQSYRLVLHYRQGLNRLEQGDDRPCVPSRLVFLYALASAKAHYGHADAQTTGQIFQSELHSAKSHQHMNKRYIIGQGDVQTGYFVHRTDDGRYVL